MAKRKTKKKQKLAELPAQGDPRASLDSALFLSAAQPVLKLLDADLLERAKASLAVMTALQARHAAEKAAERTADGFVQWRERFIAQVGAAWLLSCVFVRTLEDRGLLDRNRIAGPGAADAQRLFFQMAPSLTERDYLLTVFRELSRYPAAAGLFDARHNPVWLLAPSADATKALLALFRTPNADEPAFRFGQASTRFLGDLYQDLDEGVRKRFALLQTPDFVEAFILDRTLEPAIEKFGLDDTDLIDPTCGSGHFLLGAFDRLFEHRLRAQPGLNPRQLAHAALDKVHGSDINPYAAAIARFRLTLSFLDKAGYDKISAAPRLPLHVAVADSLLYNPQHEQASLFEQEGVEVTAWEKRAFALEDEAEARAVLGRQYAAVVGNPPYITVKDKVLRDRYREIYASAHRSYSLGVPFTERFFQLGRKGARIGMITANSFMKRELGTKLIMDFFPTVDLDLIVNTSGAYIPGHGTPTVLLFGAAQEPSGDEVLAVLAKRGEPSTPAVAKDGLVWSAISTCWNQVGFENDYISVANLERTALRQHPWSLAGGGAAALKKLVEDRTKEVLGDVVDAIGRTTVAGEDGVWIAPQGSWARRGLAAVAVPLVIGECVRDWGINTPPEILYPYKEMGGEPVGEEHPLTRQLWPWRAVLERRTVFGKQMKATGRPWWEHLEHYAQRLRTPLTITFAFVATHNHFVLDRGGKVFNRSAPIIKLPETATEDDHLALLAYLNSSTACFWMKQVCHNKSNASQKHTTEPARAAYEFAGTALSELPLPELPAQLESLARSLEATAHERARWLSGEALREHIEDTGDDEVVVVGDLVATGWRNYDLATARCVYLQEEIDWCVYRAFGFTKTQIRPDASSAIGLGDRPFEAELGYDAGISTRADRGGVVAQHFDPTPEHWKARSAEVETSAPLRLLEDRVYKRMWRETEQNVDLGAFRQEAPKTWLRLSAADSVEALVREHPLTARAALAKLGQARMDAVATYLDATLHEMVASVLAEDAVPYLASWRFTESGLTKHAAWQRVWQLQASEDGGDDVGQIDVPPQYANGSRGKSKDFAKTSYWRLRGKLDVPKERFISYPGCESDEDKQPIYGWAGWDHEQRAKALATLYYNRKNEEGWEKDRLTPMLAGLLELLFWLKLWHDEKSDDYGGGSAACYYEGILEAECQALGLTHDDLRAWRPPKKTKKKRAPKKAAASVAEE